jgi:hypothetical protein
MSSRTKGEVEGLCWEVTDDVGGVTSPQRQNTFFSVNSSEAVHDALVGGSQTTLLDLEGSCVR